MELGELAPALMESLVDVVATLGPLVATVAGADGDVELAVSPKSPESPKSLHKALEAFMDHLKDALGHRGVTSLGETLATSGATWADVAEAARAWQDSVAAVRDKWAQLVTEATELEHACGDTANAEAITVVTKNRLAGDLGDKATLCQRAGDTLVATGRRLPLAMTEEDGASALAEHEARLGEDKDKVTVAIEDWRRSVVAKSEGHAATKRGQRAEAARGPLRGLVAACDKATAMVRELWRRLGDIEATLEGTKEAFPDVPPALEAQVAEAERLWKASARLATRHLLGTLEDIPSRLQSGPGGPAATSVAEGCQKAREDIPRLLARGTSRP